MLIDSKVPLLILIQKKILGLKIGTKIILFYFLILVFSLVTSVVLYQRISSGILSRKVSDVSLQNLHLIDANINSLITRVSNYSIAILADENTIQRSLRQAKLRDLTLQLTINRYLMGMLEFTPDISSIYIFDNYSQRYYADLVSAKRCGLANINQAPWYPEVLAKNGGYLLKRNAGGIFSYKPGENYVSLIRVINDLNSQNRLGILIINIPNETFLNIFKNVGNVYGTNFFLEDATKHVIAEIRNESIRDLTNCKKWFRDDATDSTTAKINRKWYLISHLTMEGTGWNLFSLMPFDELSRESRIFNLIAFLIILLNTVVLFFSSVLVSKFITVPIYRLLNSMKDVEQGQFKLVEVQTGADEIGKLKDSYNMMIQEIQKLIQKRVEEQKAIRKAELNVLQAQIKPHFLYNTFDTISSLTLAGRSNEVYFLVKALGSFYRTSLSKGNEVITIGEELETVKNYLAIQSIRYGDLFTVKYDIDEGVKKYSILKLILQPLVENSLYHGIRPKGKPGKIEVTAKKHPDFLELVVADDGVGMADTQFLLKTTINIGDEKSGFGLSGTIERLRIFYGLDDVVAIESKIGEGTRIVIKIPFVEEVEKHGA
jgi:two-component system sensor histidine kinase YesM